MFFWGFFLCSVLYVYSTYVFNTVWAEHQLLGYYPSHHTNVFHVYLFIYLFNSSIHILCTCVRASVCLVVTNKLIYWTITKTMSQNHCFKTTNYRCTEWLTCAETSLRWNDKRLYEKSIIRYWKSESCTDMQFGLWLAAFDLRYASALTLHCLRKRTYRNVVLT